VKKKVTAFCLVILLIPGAVVFAWSPERFNRLAEREYTADRDLLPFLKIRPGIAIADIGAGGGFFSYRFARLTGSGGRVYAVDIDPESLSYIKKMAAKKRLSNLVIVKGSHNSPNLAEKSMDLIFIRNTYHHISNRVEYFSRLKKVMKPGGRLVVVEYAPDKLSPGRKSWGHYTETRIIKRELRQAGWTLSHEYGFLKKQSFLIFSLR